MSEYNITSIIDTAQPGRDIDQLLHRMLLIACALFVACSAACVGSVSISLIRFRLYLSDDWKFRRNDVEAQRGSRGSKKTREGISKDTSKDISKDPSGAAQIAERACDIAFERMGLHTIDKSGHKRGGSKCIIIQDYPPDGVNEASESSTEPTVLADKEEPHQD
jgi:hypothetical protein